MSVLKKFAVGSTCLGLLLIPPLAASQASGDSPTEVRSMTPQEEYKLQRPTRVKTEEYQSKLLDFYIAVKANIEEQQRIAAEAARVAAERQRAAEAAQRRQYQSTHQSSNQSTTQGPAVSGSCASMAPAGFPGYIVQRESGGDPNAYNSSSGARGCAQILDSHFRSGAACAGLSYAACWSKLWAGGAGASHWACTPESGCG